MLSIMFMKLSRSGILVFFIFNRCSPSALSGVLSLSSLQFPCMDCTTDSFSLLSLKGKYNQILIEKEDVHRRRCELFCSFALETLP